MPRFYCWNGKCINLDYVILAELHVNKIVFYLPPEIYAAVWKSFEEHHTERGSCFVVILYENEEVAANQYNTFIR